MMENSSRTVYGLNRHFSVPTGPACEDQRSSMVFLDSYRCRKDFFLVRIWRCRNSKWKQKGPLIAGLCACAKNFINETSFQVWELIALFGFLLDYALRFKLLCSVYSVYEAKLYMTSAIFEVNFGWTSIWKKIFYGTFNSHIVAAEKDWTQN